MDDLADLLRAVADEHHEVFAATDGVDPEWAEWYARRLAPRLSLTSAPIVVDPLSLAWLTVEQMVEADRSAIDDFGISLLQMMEHAGSALADLVQLLVPVGRITVLAGAGNNGGGGLCAARHLANRGRDVEIVLASDTLGDSVRHHLRTLSAMGIEPSPQPTGQVVVDALVGYGLEGPLRGRAAELAAWSSERTVISLDFPSGHGFSGAVTPSATLMLALPKASLRDVRPLYLADLGLPEALWQRMGVKSCHPFAPGRIVQVGP